MDDGYHNNRLQWKWVEWINKDKGERNGLMATVISAPVHWLIMMSSRKGQWEVESTYNAWELRTVEQRRQVIVTT